MRTRAKTPYADGGQIYRNHGKSARVFCSRLLCWYACGSKSMRKRVSACAARLLVREPEAPHSRPSDQTRHEALSKMTETEVAKRVAGLQKREAQHCETASTGRLFPKKKAVWGDYGPTISISI